MGELSDVSFSKVRDLIFAYERQSSYIEAPESGPISRQRAKSMGNGLSYKQFRQPNIEIHNLLDIEKELVKIEAHLNYYEVYEKETHVAFQEQLFNILTSIVSIDAEGHENTIQKKKDLIVDTSKLARILNSKLPFEGTHSHKTLRRTYSNVVRRDEAVVSTTSRSRTVNGGYKSEESLNSTRDSVDLSVSSKQDDVNSVDLNRPESASPTPVKQEVIPGETGFLPSVSRLKKFFSFKRDEKPEIRVTTASYSGLSRSQSLNLKSSTYVVSKRERVVEKRKEESIVEDGSGEDETNTVEAANDQVEVYNEPVKEIEEYREAEEIGKMNISVSKLKSLFEDRQKENGEGNYLNSTGLGVLRNVDIKTKSEISKSKSLSDLKSESFHYSYRDIDLSNEIDENENGNGNATFYNQEDYPKNENGTETYQEEEEDSGRQPESLTFNKVEILKKSFESFNNSLSTSVQKHEEDSRSLIIASELSSGPESILQEQESVLEELPFEISRVTTETTESDEEKEGAKVVVASGTVEVLKHTFEHLSATISGKTEDTLPSKPEETLKANDESKRKEVLVSAESVQDLRKSFESLSRSNSRDQNTSIEALRTVVVPVSSHNSTVIVERHSSSTIAEKVEENVPSNPEETLKSANKFTKEAIQRTESVQELKKSFESLSRSNSQEPVENLRTIVVPVSSHSSAVTVQHTSSEQYAVTSTTTEQSKNNSYTVQLESPSQEVPAQIIIENNTVVFDNNAVENGGSVVPISLYNTEQTTDSSEIIAQKSLARVEIENKTANLMKILETPVAYSTITGESYNSISQSQRFVSEIASSSHNNLSVINAISAEPVQRKLQLVSSEKTSSQTSTMKFSHSFEEESYSKSVDISDQPDTTIHETTIAQIDNDSNLEHYHSALSTSQENILDEILNNSVPNDIDEEFEKLLRED